MRPKRLALGAAIGRPSSLLIARNTGWALCRTATVGRPLVTRSGMSGCFGRISVSGPGQNAAVSWFTVSAMSAGTMATFFRSPRDAMWTMSGSNDGRSLAAKTLATAAGFSASAARP